MTSSAQKQRRGGWLAKFGACFANWAQVGTFFVILVGYVVTVRPVYQKEQLAEDVARMQRELDLATAGRDEALAEKEKLDRRSAALSQSNESLANQVYMRQAEDAVLKDRNQKLAREVEEASARLKVAKSAMSKVRRIANQAQREVIDNRFQLVGMQAFVNMHARAGVAHEVFRFDSTKNVADSLRDGWSDLKPDYESLIDRVASLDAAKLGIEARFLRGVVQAYRANLESLATVKLCKQPDFAAWEDQWESVIASVRNKTFPDKTDPKYLECVQEQVDYVQRANGWSDRRLDRAKKAAWWPEYIDTYTSRCSLVVEDASTVAFQTEVTFRIAWGEAETACSSHALEVYQRIYSGDVSDFPESDWRALEPPAPR